MADWDAFHAKVVALAPQKHVVETGHFMVGVLRPDRNPNADQLSQSDFLWFKTRGGITISKVTSYYRKKYPNHVHMDLCHKGNFVPRNSDMKDLGTVGDTVISLHALVRPPRPLPRLPMLARDHSELGQSDVGHDQEPSSIESSARLVTFDGSIAPSLNQSARQSRYPEDPAKATLLPQVQTNSGAQAPLEAAPVYNGPRVSSSRRHLQQTTTEKPKASIPAGSPFSDDVRPTRDFKIDTILDNKPPSKQEQEASARSIDQHIHQVISTQDVRMLEAGVARSKKMAAELKEVISRFGSTNPDAATWAQSIDNLLNSSRNDRTVIGVVGNTGAGKSSIINALLDEERLVPTNCMRACTTVVTEISWNYDDNPEHRYRAEVEFIDASEWDREVKVLMQEFLTEDDRLVSEAHDANSDSGIAWTKFRAVYPKMRGEDFRDRPSLADKLLKEPAVRNVLGTTKTIERARPGPFYQELQKYVDSKEKTIGKKSRERSNPSKPQMEIWPLIKVVRLYTKSNALSTGAVVVDLPGVHDSNAARAAVAEKYMKQCTGLWIVAPINRAVDDKAAQKLLGDTFRRQLKYDGNYSAVTFICSKTDDISIEEASTGLDLTELPDLEKKNAKYENEIEEKKRNIAELHKEVDRHRIALNQIDDEIEVWEELKDRVDDNEEVFAPGNKNQKRKKGRRATTAAKRPRIDEFSDVEGTDSEHSDSSDESFESDELESLQEPLTLEVVDMKIAELKAAKKKSRQEMRSAEDELKHTKSVLRKTQTKYEQVDMEIKAVCIQGRNQYSKGAIQHDFAAGIKELDQEAALEADEESFNPDEDTRDYVQVAESLPVFCVSSRAYQKLCGRLKRDESILGFRSPQDTEVPQLQEHCKKLTEGTRLQTCRSFLLSLCQQLTTLSLWASTDRHDREMTEADKDMEAAFLKAQLEDLEKALNLAVTQCLTSIKTRLQEHVVQRMKELVNEAIVLGPTIAESWGRDKNQGGLRWNTYRAVVRHGGVFHSAHSGHRDFNAELLEPITKKLANGWEHAFQRLLPRAFDFYSDISASVLRQFHEYVEARAHDNGTSLAMLGMLRGSIRTYEKMFQDLNIQLKTRVTDAQRDANRDFTPTVASTMATVYNACVSETGAGSFGRMKTQMINFVHDQGPNMFLAATDTVERALSEICRGLEQEMSQKADEVFQLMQADYMQVLGALNVDRDTLTSPERSLRSEIVVQLEKMNTYFERLANEGITEEDTTEDMTSVPQYDGGNDTEQPSQSGSDSQRNSDTCSTSRFGTANTEGTMEDHGDGLKGPGTAEPSPSASQASVSANEEVAENDELWADALLTNILKGTDELA